MEEIRNAQIVDDIELVQLTHFQKQLPVFLFGQMIVALVVAVLISVRFSVLEIAVWIGLFTITILGRAAMYTYQTIHPNTANNYQNRMFWHVVAVAVTALLWGALAFTLIDENQPLESLVIVMVLVGLVAGSVGTTFNLKPVFFVFSIFTIMPAVIKLISIGQPQYMFWGILLLFYLYLVSEFEKRVYWSIDESIQLRFKNLSLIHI